MGFEWDPAKAEANLVKHAIDFEDAKLVFEDPFTSKSMSQDPVSRKNVIWSSARLMGFSTP